MPPNPGAPPVPGSLNCTVFRACNLRLNSAGAPPDPFVKLRILTIPRKDNNIQCETSVIPNTCDPEYNQEFTLNIPDANCSQLEITVWDQADTKGNTFLGQIIEQDFDVKQGKQYKSKNPAKGKMMMQLEFIGTEDTGTAEQPTSVLPENVPSEMPTTPKQPEKMLTPRPIAVEAPQIKIPRDQPPPFAVDVMVIQGRNLVQTAGVVMCISFINDPSTMEQHHFLLLDHNVTLPYDPTMLGLNPQFRSKTVQGLDPTWNESCRLVQTYPNIQFIEQAHKSNRLDTLNELLPLAGQTVLMLVTVHAANEFCGRIIIPKLHTGHPADQWFMLQAKDGQQLKGPTGQPSALRMRINYGATGNTSISAPVSPATAPLSNAIPSNSIQLPPGWEQKLDPSGKIFYVNHQLRTFSWTPPPMPVGTPPRSAPVIVPEKRPQERERSNPGRESEVPIPPVPQSPPAQKVPVAPPSPPPGSRNQTPRQIPKEERAIESEFTDSLNKSEKTEQKRGSFQDRAIPNNETEHESREIINNNTRNSTPREDHEPKNVQPRFHENMDWRITGMIVAGRDLPKINPSALSSPFLCLSVINNAEAMDPKQQDRIDHVVNRGNRGEMFTSKGRICRILAQHTSRVVTKSLNPSWNEEFTVTESHPDFQTLDRANQVRQSKPASERVKLSGDSVLLLATIHDSAKDDAFIGRFVIPSLSPGSSSDNWFNLTNQDGKQQVGINGKPSAVCLRFSYEQYIPEVKEPTNDEADGNAQSPVTESVTLDTSVVVPPSETLKQETAPIPVVDATVQNLQPPSAPVGAASKPIQPVPTSDISPENHVAPIPASPISQPTNSTLVLPQVVTDHRNEGKIAESPVQNEVALPETQAAEIVKPSPKTLIAPPPPPPVVKTDISSPSPKVVEPLRPVPFLAPSIPAQVQSRAPEQKNEGANFPSASYPGKPSPHQAKVVVTIIEGKNFPRAMDNYLCDPMCEVTIETKGHGADLAKTSVSQNRCSPIWNEQFIFGIDAEHLSVADLKIQLLDWNAKGESRSIGYIPRIPVAEMVKRRQINTWFDILSPADGKKLSIAPDSSTRSDDQGSSCSLHIVLGFEAPVVQAEVGPVPLPSVDPEPMESKKRAHEPDRYQQSNKRSPESIASPLPDKLDTSFENAGVGIAMRSGPRGEHVIEFAVEGGPAALSRKILSGDILMDIDGLSTANKSISEVQSLLKGKPGSPITMTLSRSSDNSSNGAPTQVVVTLMRKALSTLTAKSPSKTFEKSPVPPQRDAPGAQRRTNERERNSPARSNDRPVLISKGGAASDPYLPLREEFASLFRHLSLDRMDPEMSESAAWAGAMLHGISYGRGR